MEVNVDVYKPVSVHKVNQSIYYMGSASLLHSSTQLTSKVSAKASGAVADLGVVVATSTCIAIKTYYVDLVLA